MSQTEDRLAETDEIIAAWAWVEAGDNRHGHHIGCLSEDIAAKIGGDKRMIRDAIMRDLRGRAEVAHEMHGGLTDWGRTSINGQEVYWLDNNATTEWYSDEPEWWDAQIAQAKE